MFSFRTIDSRGYLNALRAASFLRTFEYLVGEIAVLETALRSAHREALVANVKDEPREGLARLVALHEA